MEVVVRMEVRSGCAYWLHPQHDTAVDDHAAVGSVVVSPLTLTLPATCFKPFANLRAVFFPRGLRTIKTRCFQGCSQLAVADLQHVKIVEASAFDGCALLTSVRLDHATFLGQQAFRGCTALRDVTFGVKLRAVGSECFSKCTALLSVVFPASVRRIGYGAFYDCANLVVFSGSRITILQPHTFAWCSDMTECNLPNSVGEIGRHSFFGCTSLTKLNVPYSVESIDNDAFQDCSRLKSFVFPPIEDANVGRGVLCGCTAVAAIVAPLEFSLTSEMFRYQGADDGCFPKGLCQNKKMRARRLLQHYFWSITLHRSGKLTWTMKTWVEHLLLVGARARLHSRPVKGIGYRSEAMIPAGRVQREMPCVSNDVWLFLLTYFNVSDMNKL